MNYRRTVSGLLLLVIGMLVLTLCCGFSDAKVITVDDDGGADYETIQDAINASVDGDDIRVWEGTYNENIVIGNQISVIGNGSINTTIYGRGDDNVVKITDKEISFSGFKIRNSGTKWNHAGIFITSGNKNSIFDNDCSENKHGIRLQTTHYNNIYNNTCSNSISNGIHLASSSYNKIFVFVKLATL